jgi:muramoyltetrapeptide carboxypeptidase LdcA involved in peptidoglycan recycling
MSLSSKRKVFNLLKPNALKSGACIGIATPSMPGNVILKSKFLKGISFLEKQGFKIKLGDLTASFLSQGYRSGSIADRAKEFNDLYKDTEVSAIIFSIGGSNSASILPYIDYDYIRKYPKIISGYSDITSIHAALNTNCGLCTFYGPAIIPSFGTHPRPDKFTFENFLIQTGFKGAFKSYSFPTPEKYTDQFIDATKPLWTSVKRNFKKNKGWQVLRAGKAKGKMFGYNLNALLSLAGTAYFPSLDGAILCLEQMNTSMANEEKQLTQLKQMGIFDGIKGLIISKPENFSGDSDLSYEDLITEIIPTKTKFPIILNFDCGHTHPMLTIAQGVTCELVAGKNVQLTQMECGFAV